MIRRMMAFSGVPTALGIVIFFASYFLVINQVVELPNVAVLLTTMGCFGLGVIGLSYGALSTSWDETLSGSLLGWQEFNINLGRVVDAWRESRQKSGQKQKD